MSLRLLVQDVTLRAAMLVAVGAVVGGLGRWLLAAWLPRDFPVATVAVNVIGSFALAFLMFGGIAGGWLSPDTRLLVGVGMLGAFTTMSTFAYDTLALADEGAWWLAGLNFMLNPVLSLVAAFAGRSIALAWVAGG